MNICNFDCKIECGGKCCVGETTFTLEEIFKYRNDFIFGMTLLMFDGSIVNKEQRKLYEKISFCKIDNVYYVIDFFSYNLGRCLQSDENGLCKLHNDKPKKCSLLPFQPFQIESNQFSIFQQMRNKLKKSSECVGFLPINETSHTLYKGKKFTDKKILNDFNNYNDEVSQSSNIFKKLYENPVSYFGDYIKSLPNNIGILRMDMPFEVLYELFFYVEDEIMIDFIKCQLKLCVEYRNRVLQKDIGKIQSYEKSLMMIMSAIESNQ